MKTILSLALITLSFTACHTHKTSTPSTMTDASTAIPWVKDMIDPAQANAMGDAIEKNVLAAYSLYNQDEVTTYIQKIGGKVATFSARPHHPTYEFFVLDTQQWINVGLPGGHVFISRGLLKQIKNEDELAGLLGSSISHITHQHLLSWLQNDQKLDLNKAVDQKDAVWDAAYQKLTVEGFEGKLIDKADRSGISYAMHAGYNPDGLQNVLQRLSTELENNPSLDQQGQLGHNALMHRSSMGIILLEQARVHKNIFSTHKGHFHKIKKHL